MRQKHIKHALFSLAVLAIAFLISIFLQDIFHISEHITTVFTFAIFIISLRSSSYIYGIVSALIGVFAINYAFTYPYFSFDFSSPETVFSAIIMLIISVLTGVFTTKVKQWKTEKTESEKERMRANLLRSVSHDLRTPLTTIYGASSSIVENYDKLTDEQKQQMVCGIKEESQWLIRIVENLLSITKVGSNGVALIKTPTVLDELIDSVILKFNKRYPGHNVIIEVPEELVIIPMDAILIEQVIVNILENAVHHATGFTELRLGVTAEKNRVIFEIQDNGCGISQEKLGTIFSGCSQISDSNTDTHKRNAGIGLSVCATIVKAHGGEIFAENSKKGGAVFRFYLESESQVNE